MRFSTFAAAVVGAASTLMAGTMAQVPVTSGMTADSYCGMGYCLTAIMTSATNVNYSLVVPKGGAPLGWYGIGTGNTMAGSNMAVNWVNSDMTLVTSHRSASGNNMPTEAKATVVPFTVNTAVAKTDANLTIWSWTWPMQSDQPQNAQPHIYAVASADPSGTTASAVIQQHYYYETGVTLDLTKPYTGAAPAGLPSANTVAGTVMMDQRDTSKMSVRVWIVHMIFMVLGWQLLVPAGILIGRYGRTTFKWFPVHRAVQSTAFLFVFIGFFLAVGNTSATGIGHFQTTHQQLGLALFLLMIAQVLMGVFAHEIRKRRSLRVLGFIHIPTGLILFGLSVYNIHLGFDEWQWVPPAYASYIIYAWAAFMALLYIAGFALLPRELRRDRDAKQGFRGDQSPSENMPVMGDKQSV